MAAAEQRVVEVDSEDIESTDFGSTCSDRRVYLILSVSFLGGFAAAISQAFYQLDDLFPGIYWTCTGIVTVVTIFVALSLYDRDWVKLTHRRSEPYFGKSIMPTMPTMPPRLKMRGRS